MIVSQYPDLQKDIDNIIIKAMDDINSNKPENEIIYSAFLQIDDLL